MEENFIPRRLQDDKILFWSRNEFVIFIFCIGSGMIFNKLFIGLIIAIILIKFLKKLNKSGRQAFLLGFIYWFLPSKFSFFKKTPPSHLRIFN